MKHIYKLFIFTALFAMALTSCKNESAVDKSNPFFSEFNTPFNIPPFEKIMARHYMPAFEKGMADARKELQELIANKEEPTFENTIVALDKTGELLAAVNRVFYAQANSNTNDSLQAIEVEISPKLAAFNDEIRLNPELFSRVKSVYDNQAKFNLNPEQQYILENLYREFVRNGANLNSEDQDALRKINQELSVLTVRYSQNVLDETNNYKLVIDEKDLAGLPETVIAAAADVAKASGNEGKWVFTTQRPSIFPFITYSPSRELRKTIYDAYINRGNNGNESDNNQLMSDIVRLRAERAKLLGYKTHSHIVLEPRMAKAPENVLSLLDNLWEKAVPVAKNEVKEMQKIIEKEGGNFKLEPSDWWYYAEKLRKQKYDLNDSELRPYFRMENVRDGVFTLAGRLFGITFTALDNVPLPHPDAQAFEVKDADGSHIGVLYMDFFPRESKRQGAWCVTYRSHHVADGKTITPIATTVFNFTPASGDTPSLLSLEEVSTVFHEFGHALDVLFNRNTYNQTYVAWDFVELPAQIMEHWVTEPEMLDIYARHYQTGEPIPASLVKKIRNSSYFNQGFENVELLAASMLDIAYHTLEAPAAVDVQKFEKEYLAEIGLIPEIVARYRSTYFLHLMDGYDSGYYSYTWAAVLDNDAFEAFREKGIFDRATAEAYRTKILANNGIMNPMQSYISFRGHEPSIEPLLRNRGLMPQ